MSKSCEPDFSLPSLVPLWCGAYYEALVHSLHQLIHCLPKQTLKFRTGFTLVFPNKYNEHCFSCCRAQAPGVWTSGVATRRLGSYGTWA